MSITYKIVDMKPELIDKPIFITGIERSGNSIIAKALKVCGAFSGHTTSMFENKKIKYQLNRYYLDAGLDVRGQFPLPKEITNFPLDWDLNIKDIIYSEKYKEDTIWFYKSSKIAQTWKHWLKTFPEAKFIIVRRNSFDILNSCMKTGFMNVFNDEEARENIGAKTIEEAWIWWINYHKDYFDQMLASEMNCKVIWPELLIRNDFKELKELIAWVGLEYNRKVELEILNLLKKSKI